MTRAPKNLLQVRSLLLEHLNIDESSYRSDDLEPNEVGIVGDSNHRGGYHCGSDRVITNDYSVIESLRDKGGLSEFSSALDAGLFNVRVKGKTHNLRSFSIWCVAQCKANARDTRDIREIIYSPDGKVVRRWDRLNLRSKGSPDHLWHTHFSFFRDAIKAGRDQTPLFRRYLVHIGLIEPESDMTPGERWVLHVINYRVEAIKAGRAVIRVPARLDLGPQYTAFEEPNHLAAMLGADVDEQEIATVLLAALTPEKIAAAIPPTIASQVADELARRLQGPTEEGTE